MASSTKVRQGLAVLVAAVCGMVLTSIPIAGRDGPASVAGRDVRAPGAARDVRAPGAARDVRAMMRTVYASVTDKDGAPLKDLTAADFEVKEGGKVREISDVKPAASPLRLAFIVADGGIGGMQPALASILQKMPENTETSITAVVEQPQLLVDYTTDVDKLVEGIQKLSPRSNKPLSGQLMEAINDTIKTLPKPGTRPALVVIRAVPSASSSIRADVVREALRKSGVRMYVIAARNTGASGASSGGGGGGGAAGQARSDLANSEAATRGRDLETVLNDGSKDTGGRYEEFSGQALIKAAEQVAGELTSQYEISYLLPDGVDPSDRIEVTTKRKNVKVQAPTRIAN
ncbi:MAG: VWA domain-containing protein [Acidobacteria bacterium]|nr:VWA domain-containing protein [Acidobacteriota bacterium]